MRFATLVSALLLAGQPCLYSQSVFASVIPAKCGTTTGFSEGYPQLQAVSFTALRQSLAAGVLQDLTVRFYAADDLAAYIHVTDISGLGYHMDSCPLLPSGNSVWKQFGWPARNVLTPNGLGWNDLYLLVTLGSPSLMETRLAPGIISSSSTIPRINSYTLALRTAVPLAWLEYSVSGRAKSIVSKKRIVFPFRPWQVIELPIQAALLPPGQISVEVTARRNDRDSQTSETYTFQNAR